MSLAVKSDKKYTYADYLLWGDGERWELINGEAYTMTPAPVPRHQEIAGSIYRKIADYCDDKACKVYIAPFDVCLAADYSSENSIDTVVQPDISVICDISKINTRGCMGAPDLIVEILSPSTAYKDQTEKLKLYEKYGVKEYWIVNPDAKVIEIFSLDGDVFKKPDYFRNNESVNSRVLSGFTLDMSAIFEE